MAGPISLSEPYYNSCARFRGASPPPRGLSVKDLGGGANPYFVAP